MREDSRFGNVHGTVGRCLIIGMLDTTSQVANNYFTEMCSSSETSSYSMLIDFECHSTLGLRVIKIEKTPRFTKPRRALTDDNSTSQNWYKNSQ